MIVPNLRRSANKTTICIININSFKDCDDDRTSDLSNLFNFHNAHIYILTETKLTKETAIKFNQFYLGKRCEHSVTTDIDAGAGVSIAYDPLIGRCEVIPLPFEIQNRAIAVRFTPPNAEAVIVMGIYAHASGNTATKRDFFNKVFETRTSLQHQFKCNIIIGGDFNSTIGHLHSYMHDFKNATLIPDSTAKAISTLISECNYVHPFASTVLRCPGRQYLTFQCTTRLPSATVEEHTITTKGIDHILFPATMINQLEDICVSDQFFAGSKHKAVSIVVKNLMNLPISMQNNQQQFIPSLVWNDPDFCNSSKLICNQYMHDRKDCNNSNWDSLMNDIRMLALRSKRTMLRALLLDNESHPNPDTKSKIAQFIPSSTRSQKQWARSVSNAIPFLKDTKGNSTSVHKDMCSIAAKHLKNIFKNSDTCSEQDIEAYLSSVDLPKFTTEEKDMLTKPFSLDEFIDTIKCMPSGKSCGKDNIPIDVFKNSVDLCSILVACTNNTFQRNQPLPISLRSVLFRLIPKDLDHDPTDLDNYRPIGLLPMAYRIISKVVTTRLQPALSRLIGPHQFAYVNGRRSENIGRVISEMMMQTISGNNPAILNVKLDFRKAFDSVSFQYIRCFLRRIETPSLLTNFIMHILTNLNGAVIVNNGSSTSFPISRGTTQGSALSAILFVLCLEGLCRVAISNPDIYGAASIPQLKLSLALLAFADDMNIFTVPQCITAWLNLLSDWGSLSGVTLNISKSLLNLWSNIKGKNNANILELQQLLLTHPCHEYRAAGIFNSTTNKLGWKIGENADFKLLGILYSFTYQTAEHDFHSENFNVRGSTKLLISFASNTWNLKIPLAPDPRISLASVLYNKSDNMFDRLVDLKSLFVSGLIFRFYNCPCPIKTISLNQNQANVVMLSLAALKTPYVKLNTLFQPPSDGGCNHVSISSIQKSISVHTIILLLSGLCDKWVYCTYKRDLLRIVQANCFRNEAMKFLPFESILHAGLHYLFGLPLISSLVLLSGKPMLWTNYASISSFISLPKNTTSSLTRKISAPTTQDMKFFRQLILQPLWLNNLFLDPATSKPINPTCQIIDLILFKDIWNISQCSIVIPTHKTTCSLTCTHDHNCIQFWAPCIPHHITDFAAWCSPFYIQEAPSEDNTQHESTIFSLEIQPSSTHNAIPLQECSVKILTAYYTRFRAGPADVNLITGVCGWSRHWPQYSTRFTWKAYFELLEHQGIDKSVRDAYWRLLHRCNISKANNTLTLSPYVYCIHCRTTLNQDNHFTPEHAIIECPAVWEFWLCIIKYVLKINRRFDNRLSFLTIISLGLHSMDNRDCHINIRTATHNIIGLGIKTLTMFPIDSSNSPQKLLQSFRQQFRQFIKTAVESKINAHLFKHGTDPEFLPALRSSLASELSIWNIIRDNNPESIRAPTWSDYTYVDPV